MQVFYGANTFFCNDTYITRRFLRALSPRKLAALRNVYCLVVPELRWAVQFQSLKVDLEDLVKDFGHTALHLDALRVLLQVHGEGQRRDISYNELDGFKTAESMRTGRRVIVSK